MKKKILIADDEVDLVEVLKVYLEMKGYEVLTAHDGEKALEVAQGESPDLILLDVIFPKMDGYTVLRELRGRKETKSIPVVMITAKGKRYVSSQVSSWRSFFENFFSIIDEVKA